MEKSFFLDVVTYYIDSMKNISQSLKALAEIQKSYPTEYEEFRKISETPEEILKMNLSEDEKIILFEVLLKSATSTQRIGKMITLTTREKVVLADELLKSSDELTQKLKKINQKLEAEKEKDDH